MGFRHRSRAFLRKRFSDLSFCSPLLCICNIKNISKKRWRRDSHKLSRLLSTNASGKRARLSAEKKRKIEPRWNEVSCKSWNETMNRAKEDDDTTLIAFTRSRCSFSTSSFVQNSEFSVHSLLTFFITRFMFLFLRVVSHLLMGKKSWMSFVCASGRERRRNSLSMQSQCNIIMKRSCWCTPWVWRSVWSAQFCRIFECFPSFRSICKSSESWKLFYGGFSKLLSRRL